MHIKSWFKIVVQIFDKFWQASSFTTFVEQILISRESWTSLSRGLIYDLIWQLHWSTTVNENGNF